MIHVLDWSSLILMAVQAVGRVGGKGDDILNGGADLEAWVDIPGGIVAGSAIVKVS